MIEFWFKCNGVLYECVVSDFLCFVNCIVFGFFVSEIEGIEIYLLCEDEIVFVVDMVEVLCSG